MAAELTDSERLEQLKSLIHSGQVMPENGRFPISPDTRSQWENVVREIYAIARRLN